LTTAIKQTFDFSLRISF